MPLNRIVIVGAGEAGVAAVGALRAHGYSGEIVQLSAETTHPYSRPPLSKAALRAPETLGQPIKSRRWFEDRAVDLRLGAYATEILAAERRIVVRASGRFEVIPYDDLLLATGATVRRLWQLAPLGSEVIYLRTLNDACKLRARLERAARVAVVGGGVIGLEVASTARELGKTVTVIELAGRLMARAVSPPTSETLLDLHRSAGVTVHLSRGLAGVEAMPGGGARLILQNRATVEADLIVAGVGVIPNGELVRAVGCATRDGILVDDQGRTSVPHVYAAGDVANFPHPLYGRLRLEAWQHARKHGAHVGAAMLCAGRPYVEIPWFWTDQYGVNLQVAGLPNLADEHAERGATTFHLRDSCLIGATTINDCGDMRPAIKLIAAGWRGESRELLDRSKPLALALDATAALALADEATSREP